MSAQPRVSIVTPMHNGAEFLSECIESVLAQTYQNWDYTIVDNRSTDESARIAQRYAARDPRIRVVENQEFLRAIPNHNHALRQISPESRYCKVVFADDWIYPDCLEKMVAVAEAHPTAGLIGAYCLEGREVICTGLPYSTTLVSGREICREHILNGLFVFGSANSVLYRADLLRRQDPFYNEANIHADTEACFALLETADFGFVHQVLTFTRVRPGSLTKMSEDLHTDLSGTLRILLAHGRHYLTESEWRIQLDEHVAGYYRFLGKSVLLRRNRKFWDYHRAQLIDSGLGFSRSRLAAATVASLFGVIVPRTGVIDRLRRRRATTSDLTGADESERPTFAGQHSNATQLPK